MLEIIPILFKMIVIGLAVLCAISDARTLTIPNKYIIAIIALFPVAAIISSGAFPIVSHLSAAALVFGLSFVLFNLKLMGGGDSKMAAALALWIGLNGLIAFIMFMALTGGILAAISLILKKNMHLIPDQVAQQSWFGQLKENKSVVPYGIAIATGGIFGLI